MTSRIHRFFRANKSANILRSTIVKELRSRKLTMGFTNVTVTHNAYSSETPFFCTDRSDTGIDRSWVGKLPTAA